MYDCAVDRHRSVVGRVGVVLNDLIAYFYAMNIKKASVSLLSKELLFQILLHGLVFSFYFFDKNENPQIQPYHIPFFLNYAIAAFFINYFLLPRFYYRKRYLPFFIGLAITITAVIVMEEAVLEKIYFPDTKGQGFPGVFYSLFDVLPIIVILSGFKFAWDALRKQKEVEELRAAVQDSELQFLKSQINPHFLFNNLNNLYAYAIEQSPKTPQIILELSAVLRYMLYECKEAYVPLAKEVEQLANFTRLYELQIEERGEVRFHTHGIQPDYQIAPLILIVFIENAFKHSQASQSDNIKIDIEVKSGEDGVLYFHCKNNYQEGSNMDKLSNGIGLKNVKKRLALVYPGTHQLRIKKTDTVYEVDLVLQL
jgi:two-component system LytT family sensor kinase